MAYARETPDGRFIGPLLCDGCGIVLFPDDQTRYDHPERWTWHILYGDTCWVCEEPA